MGADRAIKDNVIKLDYFIAKPDEYTDPKAEFEQIMGKYSYEILDRLNNIEKKMIQNKKDGNTLEVENIRIENKRLYEELELMKHKFDYSIPIPSIIYIIITSIILGGSILSFILQLVGELAMWDIRYSLGIVIASLGLLVTAVISLKDWKEFLNEEKE